MVKKCVWACLALLLLCGCSKSETTQKVNATPQVKKENVKKSPFGKITPETKEVEALMPYEYPKGSPVDKWGKLQVAKDENGVRRLCDEKGNPVQLRGMSSHGMQWPGAANITEDNIDISSVHNDCGLLIFDREKQDVHAGGSGCGCSASGLCSYILNSMRNGKYRNILFIATGALMSPVSSREGESIPGIAHLVNIRTGE